MRHVHGSCEATVVVEDRGLAQLFQEEIVRFLRSLCSRLRAHKRREVAKRLYVDVLLCGLVLRVDRARHTLQLRVRVYRTLVLEHLSVKLFVLQTEILADLVDKCLTELVLARLDRQWRGSGANLTALR